MKKIILIPLFLLAMISCTSTQSGSSVSSEAGVVRSVQGRNYTIEAHQAEPVSMRSINLSSGYYLRVTGENIDCRLPYYGQVYTLAAAGFGSGGEQLTFRGQAEDYLLVKGKKGVMNIYFNLKTDLDRYRFEIQIYPNGKSYITVRPMSKQMIGFYGKMVLPE